MSLSMKSLLKEPLLHFVLAGSLIFAVHAWLNRWGWDAPRVVHITAAEVNWLKEAWSRQRNRAPDERELRALVTDYMTEVVLAREAVELGLDRNDTIVRRRLAQKMEFLVQDTARVADPGEDELRRLYDAERDRHQIPTRISFMQLYFRTVTGARQGLDEIETRPAATLGDPSLLERDHSGVDELAVASAFGPDFAGKVFALEAGRWHGPIASGYGFHLVRVAERQAARPRPFDEVRAQVRDEWLRREQAKARERYMSALMKKYNVVVEESVKPLIGLLARAGR